MSRLKILLKTFLFSIVILVCLAPKTMVLASEARAKRHTSSSVLRNIHSVSNDNLGMIFEYLDANSAKNLGLTCSSMNHTAKAHPPIAVQRKNATWSPVEQVLLQRQIADIADLNKFIRNCSVLLKNHLILRQDLIRRILVETSAIMTSSKPMPERLVDFQRYQEGLSSALLTSLYQPSEFNQTRALIENFFWAQIGFRITTQIGTQIGIQTGTPLENATSSQILLQTSNEISSQIGSQFVTQIGTQIVASQCDEQTWTYLEGIVQNQIWNPMWNTDATIWQEVSETLDERLADLLAPIITQFNVSQPLDADAFRAALAPVVAYTLGVYQLAALVLRYSPDFKRLESEAATIYPDIDWRVKPNQYEGDNLFVKIQLKIFELFVPRP